jgi:hypothetical protein
MGLVVWVAQAGSLPYGEGRSIVTKETDVRRRRAGRDQQNNLRNIATGSSWSPGIAVGQAQR